MGSLHEIEHDSVNTTQVEKPIHLQRLFRVSEIQIHTLINYIWQKIEQRYEETGSPILPSHHESTGEGSLQGVAVYQLKDKGGFVTIIQNERNGEKEGTVIATTDVLEEVQDVIGPIGPYPALPPWPDKTQEQQEAILDTYNQL